VAVCAMVLPVYWDLAPYLLAEEMRAFQPELVLMNGIAGFRQDTWVELGAVNRAKRLTDGSGISRPHDYGGPLVPDAEESESARPNLASWAAIKDALETTRDTHQEVLRGGTRFGDVVQGALLAGFPRLSNTYLCNNVTYTVGYLMDHHDEEVMLMEASHVRDDDGGSPVDTGLPVTLGVDMSEVPRLFMHWSSNIEGDHIALGADMMRAAIDAQLMTLHVEEGGPIRGDNDFADLPASTSGGTTN
jgi:hypothetical protein